MPTFPDRVLLRGIRIGHLTDPGEECTENQDALFVPDDPTMDTANRGVLLAVADGMGGHAGGALASRTAVETLATFYTAPISHASFERLALSRIELAHAHIQALIFERPELKGMGTTITAAMIKPDEVTIFQVGDSRAYLLRDGNLKLLTRDHTLAQRWADRSILRTPPHNPGPMGRSVLTRAVGVGTLKADRYDYRLAPGDRLLLDTDGLHGVLKEPELIQCLATSPTAWEAARKLIALAKERGAPDNLTAVVAAVG